MFVTVGGYEIAKAKLNKFADCKREPELVVITDGVSVGESYTCRRYKRPKNGLFRRFAGLKHSEDAILGFANKHGLLGKGESGFITEPASLRDAFCLCEEVTDWYAAIRDMRWAVELWDILQTDTQSLVQLIKWSEDGQCVHYESSARVILPRTEISLPEGSEIIAWKDKCHAEEFHKFILGQNILPAWYLLQRWMNKGMTEGQELRVLWKDDSLVFQSDWTILLPAMWKQLAEEVVAFEAAEPVKTAVCRLCGKEFACKRQSAAYCSGSCRMKAYRRGKGAAASENG